MSEIEEWRAIPGHEHYEASSIGRVRVHERVVSFLWMGRPKTRRCPAQIQKQWAMPKGYLLCAIDRKSHLVSRAVCAAFHGPPPSEKHEAAHLDGDNSRNVPDNLAWATHAENESHKALHGTDPVGERNGAALLTREDILPIFHAYLTSDAPTVAQQFGVDRGCIYEVVKRRTWQHVEVPQELVAAVAVRALQNRANQLNRGSR